jgi:hypothetical protein
MPIEREDETRYLRRILVENWTAVSGYGPDSGLAIHTGEPDDTSRDPQIVIDNINETPQGASGYAAMAGDGIGFVRQPDGTADIRCVAGTDGDVDPHPRWLAGQFAKEVQDILHSNWRGIPDANTGEVEYRALAPGSYRGPDSDPDAPGRWFAVQEAQYTYSTKYNR